MRLLLLLVSVGLASAFLRPPPARICHQCRWATTREALKEDILQLATATQRGFRASPAQRDEMNRLIYQLADRNPTPNPAYSFLLRKSNSTTTTLIGKWTLRYTNAPDILSLDHSIPFATLGRIGQECAPPYITNVIEWKSTTSLTSQPSILQRVVTQAAPVSSSRVQLLAAGVQLGSWVRLQGPLRLPFGHFDLLYLDDTFRIVRTSQGYYAINTRNGGDDDEEEWF